MIKALAKTVGTLRYLEFVPELLTRATIGLVFAYSGWGKLHNMPHTIEFFESLGIPNPVLQAYFVASTELVCGLAVLVGLGTRLAVFPLCVIMLVALGTAKRGDIEGLTSLFDLSEYLFLVLMLWLATRGSGTLSLDAALRRRYKLAR